MELNLKKLIRETLESLDESRMTTSTFSLVGQIGRSIPGLKTLDIKSLSDGTAGLYRYEKDGNAYEIEVRPAGL